MFKKSDLLASIAKTTQRPIEKMDKNKLVDQLKNHFTPKSGGKSDFLNKLPKNQDLAKPAKGITFESFGSRSKEDIRSITKRVVLEAAASENTANPMRLDLKSLAVNNVHSKFTVRRGNDDIVVELLYPNANNEITVKIIMKDGADKLFVVDIEDPNYVNNFGAMILKEIDKVITTTKNTPQYNIEPMNHDTALAGDGKITPVLPSLGGYAPVWESQWSNLMALIEADDEEMDAEADATQEADTQPPAVNAEGDNAFGEEDFSAEGDSGFDGGEGGDMFGGDFGGSGSLSSLGGGMDVGGAAGGSDGVNSDGMGMGGEPEEDYVQFRKKDDWTQSSLDTMQKLTADATAQQMQNGNGVVLSSGDVLKGTVGIENDSNYQIVDKFLKIYSELDEVDIPESMMAEIEDKLSKADGQFDAFLQQNLSKITGSDSVDTSLNNEMFADFKPMGGDAKQQQQPAEQSQQPADSDGGFGDLDSFFDLDAPTEADNEDEDELHDAAEQTVDGVSQDEFPNLS